MTEPFTCNLCGKETNLPSNCSTCEPDGSGGPYYCTWCIRIFDQRELRCLKCYEAGEEDVLILRKPGCNT